LEKESAYSPATPPVSSSASDRCLHSDAIEMFQNFSHLKNKRCVGVPHNNILNLFRTNTPSEYPYAVPRDGEVSHNGKELRGIHFDFNTCLRKQLPSFLPRHHPHRLQLPPRIFASSADGLPLVHQDVSSPSENLL
jgi:hypothetical protein